MYDTIYFIIYRYDQLHCAMCRYVQSSQTDLPGPANAELRLREERLSRRVCSACCRPFSLLTNRWDIYTTIYTIIYTISIYTLYNNILRRLLCSNCLLGVCRACASFQPRDQVWVCRRCSGARYSSDSIALVDDIFNNDILYYDQFLK